MEISKTNIEENKNFTGLGINVKNYKILKITALTFTNVFEEVIKNCRYAIERAMLLYSVVRPDKRSARVST